MTIVRRRHNGRYAALPNAIWESEHLSIEAKGVLGYLLSRPANWHVRLSQVGKKLDVGKDRLQRIFRELIAAGFVSREQPRLENGAFGRFEYVVSDEAEYNDVASLPQPDLPAPAEPVAAEPAPAQPAPGNTAAHINKTDSNKTDLQKTELTKTDSIKPLTPKCSKPEEAQLAAGAKGLAKEDFWKSERPEVVQSRLVWRLGERDVQKGWLLFGELPEHMRDQLTAQERCGRLSDQSLAEARLWLVQQGVSV